MCRDRIGLVQVASNWRGEYVRQPRGYGGEEECADKVSQVGKGEGHFSVPGLKR